MKVIVGQEQPQTIIDTTTTQLSLPLLRITRERKKIFKLEEKKKEKLN